MTSKFASDIDRAMHAKYSFAILSVLLFNLLSGCAHAPLTYEGQTPDYSLSGEKAKSEFQRFELEENSSTCPLPCFKQDPKRRWHTWESVLPLIETASPEAAQRYQKAQVWKRVQTYSLGIGIVGLFAGLATTGNQRDTYFRVAQAGSLTSIGSGFVGDAINSNVPEIYNRDLEGKLQPKVAVGWEF